MIPLVHEGGDLGDGLGSDSVKNHHAVPFPKTQNVQSMVGLPRIQCGRRGIPFGGRKKKAVHGKSGSEFLRKIGGNGLAPGTGGDPGGCGQFVRAHYGMNGTGCDERLERCQRNGLDCGVAGQSKCTSVGHFKVHHFWGGKMSSD